MKVSLTFLLLLALLLFTFYAQAQSTTDSTPTRKEKKYQATAPLTQPFGKEAFSHPIIQPSDG